MPVPRVGDVMSVDGPDNAVLTAAQEKEIVRELTEAAAGQVKEGDIFYLISHRWWRVWQDYVETTDHSTSEGGEPLTAFTPGSFGPFSKRPSSIENSDLIVDAPSSENQKSEPELKENLVEDRDYILLPEQVWKAFHKWYGGGPALPRKVITMGYGSHEDLAVEVYLLQVHLTVVPPGTKVSMKFSKKDTVGTLQQTICEHFTLEPENVRIWDYFNKVKNKQLSESLKSLQDAYIHMNQDILVEVRRNGKWPESSTSSFGINALSSSSVTSNGSNGSTTGRELTVLSESRSIANGPPASKPGTRNGSSVGYPTYSMDKEKESDSWPGSSSSTVRGPKGVTGLQNLGNTCFMNSALQCLVHTPPLVTYFLQDYSHEINRHNPLGMEGELAIAFGDLLRKLWALGKQPVAPRQFKTKLARFAPQFSGYNQHDSQELLAFLLDGLHEDLNRVKNKPYVEAKDADGRPDREVATEYWANHRSRNDSIIVDVCQGQYKSTLVCPTCNKVSVTFDPFMYLSLPLPAKTTRTMTVTVFSGDGTAPPTSYTVTVPRQGKYKDLIQAIGLACDIGSDERLILAELYSHRIFRVLDEPLEWLTAIRDDDRLAAYRLPKYLEKGPLLCLLHRRLELDSYTPKKEPQWKLFGAPLITCLPEEVATGATLVKVVKKLLTPMERSERTLPTESMDMEGERTGNDATQEDVDMVDGGGESPARGGNNGNEEQGQSDTLDSTQDQPESPFQLWLTDDRGAAREGSIFMDKLLPPAASSARASIKVRYVAVDWSATALDQEYDMSKVDMPPEVLRTGLPATSKKGRQEAVSLYTCLEAFLKEEPLGPEDMWYCPRCKEHRQASKKLDLWRLPEILVVHLKRFSYSRYLKNKLEAFVNFPVDDLDLSKYVASNSEPQGYVYELYAVSNHYGSMGGGHYTAYVKLVDENKWYNFDDSHVSPVNESDVKTSAAYVLFYRRIRSEESSLRSDEADIVVKAHGLNQRDVPEVDADMAGAPSHFLPP